MANDRGLDFERIRDQERVPDVTKAREMSGFEARTTLEDMPDEVVPWIGNAIETGAI